MSGQYLCRSPGRVAALRKAALASPPRLLNGIHYLEVAPDQRRVMLHFVHSLDLVPTAPLTAVNVEIRGGVRVRDPQVTGIHWIDEVMTVELASAGDFSPYLLRLVATPGAAAEPVGIDPALAEVEFRFKVDCPSDFDCRDDDLCPPTEADSPVIDYLARDYGSLLRLLLDRLSALMPDWRERNPADLWVALAEAVAFRGDELSYFQEAVATEAYLGTARRRVSVRRHTRLLDYALHDGCNARAWVAFEREVEEPADDGKTLAGCDPVTGLGGTLLLTGVPGMDPGIKADVAQTALGAGAQAFELLHPLILYSAHNRMHFYTWDHADCCLPLGATRALLRDDEANRLRLRRGDVLVLQSLLSNTSGELADADHRQRHAVRLTRVDPEADLEDMPTDGDALKRKVPPLRRDPVTDRPFVEIEWHADDALPFTLCLSKHIGGRLVEDMAGALGNVALADHGRTATDEVVLRPLPGGRLPRYPLDRTGVAPLTQQARLQLAGSEDTPLFDAAAGATAALHWEMADVRPALDLRSRDDGRRWTPRRDLLASDAEASDVVVETEDDGQAVLRFGDGINGRAPLPGEVLQVRLRTGSGAAGNVSAEAIGHVVAPFKGITRVCNPIAATGGTDPQPSSQARLFAPQAFRRQERAVTAADYAAMVERAPGVQRAVATRRWTGSWSTIFITVDRRGGGPVDTDFEAGLARFIERYRLAGHDVEIDAPRFVPLDLELQVCTQRGYFAADVERRLLRVFSADPLPAGATGFFHPDRFSFGQPVLLSAVIAAAMQVPGVAYVTAVRFQRLGRGPAGEIDEGRIRMARLEIARLDNDPNAPEHGRIRFAVDTGA